MRSERRKQVDRARRSLLWGAGLFMGLVVFVNILLDSLDVGLRDPEFDLKISRLRALVEKEPARPVVLVLGSSRVASGVDPELATPRVIAGGPSPIVFNAGLTGGGPMAEYLCLRRILAAGIKPACVVAEVFPGLLARGEAELTIAGYVERLDREELLALDKYSSRPLARQLEWAQLRLRAVSSMRFGMQYRYTSGWGFPRTQTNANWLSWEKQTDKGFNTPPKQLNAELRKKLEEKGRTAYAPHLAKFRVAEASNQALQDVVQVCRQHQIPIALVWLPEASLFQRLYGPDSSAVAEAYFAKVQRDWNLPFTNARNWIADEGFLDGHHLSAAGAAAFSQRLTRDVIEPLMQGSDRASLGSLSQ